MKFWVKITAVLIVCAFAFLTACLYVEVGGYKKYLAVVKDCSNKAGVDVSLVLAVMKTESGFDKNATSIKGAKGLMQLKQETAEFIARKIGYELEVDLYNAETNIYLGVNYIKYLSKKFSALEKVLWAYNAGEGNAQAWIDGGVTVPPYKETKNFTKKVLRRINIYKVII